MTQFMSQSMTREAALRIGLAARELGNVGISTLVTGLAGVCALPLTEEKLAGITVSQLGGVLPSGAKGSTTEALKRAVRLLWGVDVVGSDLPRLDATADAATEVQLSQAIRVACASNNGEEIDGHFGSCERFLVYQVAPGGLRLMAVRSTLEADHTEDRNAARAAMIGDCQVLYVQSIGGPAAAKVVRAGVHPVKVTQAGPARELLAPLQATLATPPPWLAKIMGVKAASLEKYAESLDES